MRDVEGKVAFITGGASGVGFGMARAFLRAGMKVVIADIRQDHLDRAMAALAGQKVHPIRLDITDRQAFAAAADESERVFGNVHLVCNNAGVNFFAPMDECTYQDWDWILGVNLGGVVNGIQTFVPRLKKHGEGGHICNTASMAALISGPGAGLYTCAKFGVRGLTECLRWSLAPHGIEVSMVCPGLVKSAIHESDKIRPKSLAKEVGPVPEGFMAMLAKIHEDGMEPDEIGEKILAGIRRNDLYIFTHPEFKEEIQEIFEEILGLLPEGEAPPARAAFEADHRRRNTEARAKAKVL